MDEAAKLQLPKYGKNMERLLHCGSQKCYIDIEMVLLYSGHILGKILSHSDPFFQGTGTWMDNGVEGRSSVRKFSYFVCLLLCILQHTYTV